jgi:hypothetical protein
MIPSFFSSPFSYSSSSSTARSDSYFLFPVDCQVALVPLVDVKGISTLTLAGHFDQVTSVVHRPVRNQILSCARDGLLLLWDCSQYYHYREKEKVADGLKMKENQDKISSEARKETSEEIAKNLLRTYPARNSVSSSSPSSSSSLSSAVPISSSSLKMDPAFLFPVIQHYLTDIRLNDVDFSLFGSGPASPSSLDLSLFSSSGFLPSQRVSAADLDWNNIESCLKVDDGKSEKVDKTVKGSCPALSGIPPVSLDDKKKKKKPKNVREDIHKILKKSRY